MHICSLNGDISAAYIGRPIAAILFSKYQTKAQNISFLGLYMRFYLKNWQYTVCFYIQNAYHISSNKRRGVYSKRILFAAAFIRNK